VFIKSGNLTLNVDIQGPNNAPVLVLLHSLGTNNHIWDYQIPVLSKHFKIIRTDIRGHGLSDIDNNGFTIDDLAQDVFNIVNELGVIKFSIAGVSIKGLFFMVCSMILISSKIKHLQ
jgi:3-oxoadipate enol-lactonase